MSNEQESQGSQSKKPAGRHSRNHLTSAEQTAAHEAYCSEHGRAARCRKADEREAARAARTPEEQIALLDRRLGVGQGATRERARLLALLGS